MVPPDQNPALRQPTLEFLRQCEKRVHSPRISRVVIDEINEARAEKREAITKWIDQVRPEILSFSAEAELLALHFVEEGVVPERRLNDARHVACALIHEIELLVSWNYRHLANTKKAQQFNAVAMRQEIRGDLEIRTPLEVIQWK